MPTLDLRRDVANLGASIPVPTLTPEDAAVAQATWRGRMINEHMSARVFAGLVPQLMAAGVPTPKIEAVSGMIADELRHAVQCAAALSALGGEPVAELPELDRIPEHDDVGPLEGALRNVLSISCLSETVAVALINAERVGLDDSPLSDLLRDILADEVQHARFGWKMLEDVREQLTPELRASLSRYLELAFGHLERHELSHLSSGPAPSEAAESVGVCDGSEARRIFFETLTQVIIPRLEEHGFAARAAWKNRRYPSEARLLSTARAQA